jgi:peptidoglycan hydrolase-like protein with peptidoglycan-binding domain
MRGRLVALFVTLATVTACADSRDAQPDDTLPRITSDSTPTTTLAPPVTAAPTTVGPPAPPTVAPTVAPTAAPPAAPTAPPTAAPTAAPTAPPTTRSTGPTSTLILTPGTAVECTGPALGAATGVEVGGVACRGGWAIGRAAACDPAQGCADVEVFHVTERGWVHDGTFATNCAEALARAGMTLHTAIALQAPVCEGDPGPTSNILPGSSGGRVTQLQIALVGLGYDLAVDGRYGPRTQAAVRDFQARNGLEVDAIAGPRTQEALGIGPGATPAATATTAVVGPSTSVVIAAGEPLACSSSAIGADTGRFGGDVRCVGGWAVVCPRGGADCSAVDVFHATEGGWVYDGTFPRACVDDLTVTGMSVHTAAEFAELCADGLPGRENILPGSTGPEVEQVQIALVALGYPLVVDGTYGPRTEAAVRDVQARNDLEVDGIAGPDTQTALGI